MKARYAWTEHVAGPFTVIMRRTRCRHYSARVYRGRALSGFLIGKRAVDEFLARHPEAEA